MNERVFPCEGCGELVQIVVVGDDLATGAWADDKLAVWCRKCWYAQGFAQPQVNES